MGSDTKDVINTLFNTILQRFQQAQETSNDKGSKFVPESVELLYYYFQKIKIKKKMKTQKLKGIINAFSDQ